MIASEFLKEFRSIGSYMGMFLAVALLGSPGKFLWFGLPMGIGTMVGMLIVKKLLSWFNSKQIFMTSGVYSLLINCAAFLIGRQSFQQPDSAFWQVLFIVFLFLIGLQFGANNLLPELFKADILEDLEVKTHKRLEGSLYKIVGIGGALSKLISDTIAPHILYGDNALNFVNYIPAIQDPALGTIYQDQPLDSKIRLLMVYTIWHGLMMLAGAIPLIFYNLTGKVKEEIHQQALEYRASIETVKDDAE